jgi:hypothetical protein
MLIFFLFIVLITFWPVLTTKLARKSNHKIYKPVKNEHKTYKKKYNFKVQLISYYKIVRLVELTIKK